MLTLETRLAELEHNEDGEEKRKRLMEEKQDLEQRLATLTARGEHQSDELEPPCSPRNVVL